MEGVFEEITDVDEYINKLIIKREDDRYNANKTIIMLIIIGYTFGIILGLIIGLLIQTNFDMNQPNSNDTLISINPELNKLLEEVKQHPEQRDISQTMQNVIPQELR